MSQVALRSRPRRRRAGGWRTVASTAVWLVIAFNLAVFAWLFINSLRSHAEIFANPWGLPNVLHTENWVNAWTTSGFGAAIGNSVLVCVTSAVGIVLLSAPAGYILAKTNRRLSEVALMYIAVGVGVPMQVIVIPLFTIVQTLGLLNSLFGLIVVYIALNLPFSVFLLAGFFRSMPDELEEAAALDGAGMLRIFAQIIAPMARSGMTTALILNLVWLWAEVFLALILIQSTEKQTLPLALLNFMAQQQYGGNDYGQLLAGIGIILLPVLAAYIWLGRRIIEGMTVGAGK
ncbi:MAG TPA: carbohydrate ABC transporter permease [Candidatus Ruania gallistercoris]|uniref:Carbohydrate ABC transporter permease n=1 Tax=Candidatus Ruania gallistercoris TaxID=2838746 RepID=A0A9D2EGJ4_9MICO|nr:carbohydrate ABC transporter permease [Candidatus Ruania gallistercoris]